MKHNPCPDCNNDLTWTQTQRLESEPQSRTRTLSHFRTWSYPWSQTPDKNTASRPHTWKKVLNWSWRFFTLSSSSSSTSPRFPASEVIEDEQDDGEEDRLWSKNFRHLLNIVNKKKYSCGSISPTLVCKVQKCAMEYGFGVKSAIMFQRVHFEVLILDWLTNITTSKTRHNAEKACINCVWTHFMQIWGERQIPAWGWMLKLK